ncbi:WAT1-related protein [Diplonema papillatum]|nr:WAT1-related protein [Diplonema papillatum]|eukprot:gene14704-22496_t
MGYETETSLDGGIQERSVTKKSPPLWMAHLACVITQVSFGGGTVVGKLGVSGTNPVLFAFIREGVAGPLLCVIAFLQHRERPQVQHMPRLLLAGFGLYLNQFCYIVGLKLTDPTTASVWQPSQPIMTCGLALLLGYERATWRKLLGIFCAFVGAALMVALPSPSSDSSSSSGSGSGTVHQPIAGNILFFFNCLGTSAFIIVTKPLLATRTYSSIAITGWSYLVGSVLMGITALIINFTDPLLDFVCPGECKGAWSVPLGMLFALLYWIIFTSVIGYLCMSWANQYIQASVVSAYSVLQPVTAAVISVILIAVKGHHWAVDEKGLEEPSLKDLSALGIVIGLGILLSDNTSDSKFSAKPEGDVVPSDIDSDDQSSQDSLIHREIQG